MYSFDEVIPFLFEDLDVYPSLPYLKEELLVDDNSIESINHLIYKAEGKYQLTLINFTTTNESGEEKIFDTHTFNLKASKNISILDYSEDDKVWSHYETVIIDLDTQEEFILESYYYQSSESGHVGDFVGIEIKRLSPIKKTIQNIN